MLLAQNGMCNKHVLGFVPVDGDYALACDAHASTMFQQCTMMRMSPETSYSCCAGAAATKASG